MDDTEIHITRCYHVWGINITMNKLKDINKRNERGRVRKTRKSDWQCTDLSMMDYTTRMYT